MNGWMGLCHRRIGLLGICLLIFSVHGCLCFQQVVIPGLDAGISGEGHSISENIHADHPPDGPPPTENSIPEFRHDAGQEPTGAESSADTVIADSAVGSCPNPADLACLHCQIALSKNETVLAVHRRMMLVSKDHQHRWVDLQTCQSQPWHWLENSLLQAIALDPDSGQLLLAATQVNGTTSQVTLGLFDVAKPEQPVRVVSLPKHTALEPRSQKPSYQRRGVVFVQEKDSTGKTVASRVVHFQMKGLHLTEMVFPSEHALYSYSPAMYLEDHEIFVLWHKTAGSTRFRYPLLIWSVKEQRAIRVIDRGERIVPSQMFASKQDVFVVETDLADRTRTELVRYPIAGGHEQKLAVPGCTALWGDNQLGILACLKENKIYRFRLEPLVAMSTINLPTSLYPVTYYSGYWYLRPVSDGTSWLRVHIADTGSVYDKVMFPNGLSPDIVAGRYPVQRSAETLPGVSYRMLRAIQTDHQQIGIMDASSGSVQWFAEKFPVPAIMGRLTELWEEYDALVTYYVEPQSQTQQPTLYYLRIADSLQVVHTHASGMLQDVGGSGEWVFPSPLRVLVNLHRRTTAGDPNRMEYELFVLHRLTWKKQQIPLSRSYTMYHSDPWVVLEPAYSTAEDRELPVYRVP